MRVVVVSLRPFIVVVEDLLNVIECDQLVTMARGRVKRSLTVSEGGGEELHVDRTSSGMFFSRGENETVKRIEERIAFILGIPVERGEGLQVLQYKEGAEYRPHYDYFDPSMRGTQKLLERGGQRIGTVIIYLVEPELGGETIFPEAGVSIKPIRGSAVIFFYPVPHPSTKTLHGGSPVIKGEKWIATKWIREGNFI